MDFSGKIVPFSNLKEWRNTLPIERRPLVATNGCFDILHAGHVRLLHKARAYGNSLIVGVNDDASVRSLKGDDRPINSCNDRALVISALESVTAVCIFPGTEATLFLDATKADVYVKGGDYSLSTLNTNERSILEKWNASIIILPFTEGRSTSSILRQIRGTDLH